MSDPERSAKINLVKFGPKESWDRFSRSGELIDYVIGITGTPGWHYMNFTSNTMIAESPAGNTIYLEVDGEKVVDAVISQDKIPDPHFEQIQAFIISEFGLSKSE